MGAVAFGIGSMIYSGLEFGQYFELEQNTKCHNIMLALTPATRMAFIFIQMYFIFLNNEVRSNDLFSTSVTRKWQRKNINYERYKISLRDSISIKTFPSSYDYDLLDLFTDSGKNVSSHI